MNPLRLLPHFIVAVTLMVSSTASTSAAEPFRRDLSTDRPDATESPYTVEAGRWQIEVEPARWTRDSEDGVRVETWSFGATNLKFGLNDKTDLQFVFEPYVRTRVRTGSVRTTQRGFGDTVVRLKANLTGNDGGSFAAAIMPFIKLPTAADDLGNGEVEGGFIFPFAFALPNDWGAGLMAEFDIARNDADTDHELAVITTATIAGEIAPRTGVFFELANEARSGRASTWALSFNTGLTYAVSDNTQLDAGFNLGLTDAADDLAVFCGFSTRW